MSKHITIPQKLTDLIEELTYLWIKWMKAHNACNTPSLSLRERRLNGEECENLQRRRQQILIELNEEFDKVLN
jgi:hypothetical protein